MNAKLVMVGDQEKPTVIRLKKLPMTVGRGREADLTLAHPMVSRLHCELYEVDNTLCIRDMGSLNGTYVGDVRVTEAALESGDLLTIGGAKFEVVVGDQAADQLLPPSVEEDGDGEFSRIGDNERETEPKAVPKKSKPSKKPTEEQTIAAPKNEAKGKPKEEPAFEFDAGEGGEKSGDDDDLSAFLAGLE